MRKSAVFGLSLLMLFIASPLASAEEEAAVYTITINYTVTNNGPTQATNARMIIFLFDNITGWAEQTVLSESISGATLLTDITSTSENRWVRISVGDLQVGASQTATVTQVLKVRSASIQIDPSLVDNSFPQDVLNSFTTSVDGLFESNNSTISALARQLTENTTNPYYMIKQIFDFVLEDPQNEQNLRYERQLTEHGALWAIQAGVGDCTEFSNLFVALARAVGIPAKVVSGYAYSSLYNPTGGTADISLFGHAYPLFYLPKSGTDYGWVPVDAVWPQYIGSFGEVDYSHIAGATTGGDGIIDEGQIRWPGPGAVREPYITYSDGEPSVNFHAAVGTITPEVLVNASLDTSSTIQNDMLTVTMKVKNMGRSSASSLVAGLENINPAYFEVLTPAQQRSSLASGEEWQTTFQVRLKDGAYGNRHTFTSKVAYDSSFGGISGTFLATGERLVNIGAKPSLPQQITDIMLYALVGVLIGVVIAAIVVFARRR